MCVAVPLLVKSIDGLRAEVEMSGVTRVVSLDLTPDAQVGDYVIVHAGFAISILDEEEAEETLQLFEQIADLMEADDEISQ
ncbi:MAG: HypC/HybG/HupF family hydrogenase formation chaperone [Anaerolineae bacterium]|nr:HypC/HybG/HupF family hydrogenase formation chaperone [Anaerolineae bacterium]NIQ78147.1 HypC/HybG/HupF family hydrogenase formation chaperone [Anaerolineae bacterium]